jgi:hypothetical protein
MEDAQQEQNGKLFWINIEDASIKFVRFAEIAGLMCRHRPTQHVYGFLWQRSACAKEWSF